MSKSFIKLNLLPLMLSIGLVSCSKDNGDSTSVADAPETIMSQSTLDTIIYVQIQQDKIPIYLSIPEGCGNENYPAVVVMHGSGGMWSNDDPSTGKMSSQNRDWREIFDNNCIVGAFVDSYSGRNVKERSGKWTDAPDNFRISSQFVRPKDANMALEVLKNLKLDNGKPLVRPNDIALLGFSDGASALAATLYDTDSTPADWEWTQSFDGKDYDSESGVQPPQPKPENGFAGGVFYYGGSTGYGYWGPGPCNENALDKNIYRPYAPILYQIPSKGYLTENTLCMIDLLEQRSVPVKLHLYEGVGHGFDTEGKEQSEMARQNTVTWLKTLLHITN